MGYRRNGANNGDVLGDFTNGRCRRCFDRCEDALEFVEAVKDLLDDFFDDDKCRCHKKCRRDWDND